MHQALTSSQLGILGKKKNSSKHKNAVIGSIFRVSAEHHLKAEYALRYLMVMVTFSLAAAIPKLDLFISLVSARSLAGPHSWCPQVGSVSSSTLALMAPAVIDTVTQGDRCSR